MIILYVLILFRGKPRGVLANELESDFVVFEFELKSNFCVRFLDQYTREMYVLF